MKKQTLSSRLKNPTSLKFRRTGSNTNPISHFPAPNSQTGFTIVELLVVIVVIGILAAVTIVAYTGVSQKAVASSLQSDLASASNKLKLYYTDNGAYPASLDGSNCPVGPADTRYCLKSSSGNTFTYSATPAGSTSPQAFRLNATNSNNSYSVTNSTPPAIATTTNGLTIGSACPAGFIPVPGSGTYATNDFCVMKYEASQVGATTTPISQSGVLPWVSISQTTAIANSPNVAGCTGCHLITEAEFLTIAQNVLSVASNWDNGAGVHTVGTGYIYSGHNDNAPANALTADPSDANGYAGTGNSSPSNQLRTLTLTNGEVIWDMAGNVYEWTTGTSTNNQPGITGGGYAWRQWNAVTTHGTLSPDLFPATTGITGASSWTSTNGIGQIYSSADETSPHGFLRGGPWSDGGAAGVLALILNNAPSNTFTSVGFRVSR